MANELRFAVTLDDSGAIRGFRNLSTAAKSAGTGVSTHMGAMGTALGKVEKGLGGVGGAMSHAKGQILGVGGAVAALAGAGGLLSLGAALEQGITKAEGLGLAVEKVSAATGLAVHPASQMVAVFEKFGIGADTTAMLLGRLEKNAFAAGQSAKSAAKFQSLYGFSVLDSSGHVKDANALLLSAADYFNKNTNAAQRDAAMAKLFGKTWLDLVPVLKLGSAGISEAAQAADALGLTLRSAQDVKSVEAFIAAQREARDAVGGLEVQLGLLAMPDLTVALKSFTGYLSSHQQDVKKFFGDAVHAAEQIGKVVTGTVVPAVQQIAGAVSTAWNAVPPEVRDLLVKAFVADKVIKWTFGVDIVGSVGKLLVDGVAGLFKNAVSANMNVEAGNVNVVGGGAGALAGGASAGGGASGIVGAVAKVAIVGMAVGVAAELAGALGAQSTQVQQQGADLVASAQQNAPAMTRAELEGAIASIRQQASGGFLGLNATALSMTNFFNHGMDNLEKTQAALEAQLALMSKPGYAPDVKGSQSPIGGSDSQQRTPYSGDSADRLKAIPQVIGVAMKASIGSLARPLDALHRDFSKGMHDLAKAVSPKDVIRAADKVARDIVKGVGSVKTTEAAINSLKAAQAKALRDGNTALAAKLGVDIRKVEAKLPGRKWVAQQERTADQIVASSKSTKDKIKELTAIQAAFTKHGDTHAAATIAAKIETLKPHIDSVTGAVSLWGHSIGSSKPKPLNAQGLLGFTSGSTDIGVAGEAGKEAVAIIRHPRPLRVPDVSAAMTAAGGRAGGGSFHGVLDVNVHGDLSGMTPGQLRQLGQGLGPIVVAWAQRNGILPRLGTGLTG